MSSAHTPGPWATEGDFLGPAGSGGTTYPLYELKMICGDMAEHEANARLIAAAPDLLEALSEVKEWIDNWSPTFTNDDEWPETARKMRAALSAATGTVE